MSSISGNCAKALISPKIQLSSQANTVRSHRISFYPRLQLFEQTEFLCYIVSRFSKSMCSLVLVKLSPRSLGNLSLRHPCILPLRESHPSNLKLQASLVLSKFVKAEDATHTQARHGTSTITRETAFTEPRVPKSFDFSEAAPERGEHSWLVFLNHSFRLP